MVLNREFNPLALSIVPSNENFFYLAEVMYLRLILEVQNRLWIRFCSGLIKDTKNRVFAF